MRTKLKFFVLGSVMAAGGLFAVAVGDLLVFKAGDPIKSGDVNTNFSTLRTAIQTLEAPVDAARLADKAVTAGKLGTSNQAGNGQILGFDGTGLIWRDLNLNGSGGLLSVAHDSTLQGDGSSANPLKVGFGLGLSGNGINGLYVGNTSTDPFSAGVKAAADGAGVWGMSAAGYGVRGESSHVGVFGLSPSGNGVLGQSTNGNGVYGSNNNSDTTGHAGYFSGRVAITQSLNFGNTTRQMINLWGNIYGIGVQNNTQYFRSDNQFAWYRDGVHADNAFDPGTGGTTLMRLQGNGNLEVSGAVKRSYSNGTFSNLAPIAFGKTDTGTGTNLVAGTPNLTCCPYNPGQQAYIISVAGVNLDDSYTVVATPNSATPVFISHYIQNSNLFIRMWNPDSSVRTGGFSFAIYKP